MRDGPLTSARGAIRATLPSETSEFGREVPARFIHVPARHAKALHPDAQLVVGMRGAGKSFWWSALQDREKRDLVGRRARQSALTRETSVVVGFGETPNPEAYPSRDLLASLMRGFAPRQIWRGVVLHALAGQKATGGGAWEQRIAHVTEHPEPADQILFEADRRLEEKGEYWLILFDALDRSATDWRQMNLLIRGLLETILDLRPYRRLRAKVFLRSDQLDERRVGDFPDASKVLSGKLDLAWPAVELYALLYQYLGGAEDGAFRKEVAAGLNLPWTEESWGWLPPEALRRDEGEQRRVFHAIAGEWMGRDRRRGYPYTWVPNHLADGDGRTSPRSFLAALQQAAEDSERRYAGHEWPLHYESIKVGVQRASEIRVRELQEDYPWVGAVMQPLSGRVVPCPFEAVAEQWEQAGVLASLGARRDEGLERLPPAHLDRGPDGVRRDLEELGIFQRLRDGRVNIPDVFRVGYGLGRRGGVRPAGGAARPGNEE